MAVCRITVRTPRSLPLSLALLLITVLAGLAVRFAPLGLPGWIVKYGASMLWALVLYWIVSALLPSWSFLRTVVLAGCVATGVEIFKLYRTPALDDFRQTLPGILLLGRSFSVWDILAYWLAIGAGAMLDARLRGRPSMRA